MGGWEIAIEKNAAFDNLALNKRKRGRDEFETNKMMKTSRYFRFMKMRPDRSGIKEEWIVAVIENPVKKETQPDGRIRLWGKIKEANKFLRVILLEDQKTVHNAFFDRTFKEV